MVEFFASFWEVAFFLTAATADLAAILRLATKFPVLGNRRVLSGERTKRTLHQIFEFNSVHGFFSFKCIKSPC